LFSVSLSNKKNDCKMRRTSYFFTPSRGRMQKKLKKSLQGGEARLSGEKVLTKYNNIVILTCIVWNIEYYQSEAGRSPVVEFIDSLEATAKARVARTLDLLEEFGIELGMPYARHLEKHLWELRARQGRNRYRIIYFLATGQTFVLLHGFTKKAGPVPRSDMEMAERRRDDYLSRRR